MSIAVTLAGLLAELAALQANPRMFKKEITLIEAEIEKQKLLENQHFYKGYHRFLP
jgi:hypothetical protein